MGLVVHTSDKISAVPKGLSPNCLKRAGFRSLGHGGTAASFTAPQSISGMPDKAFAYHSNDPFGALRRLQNLL